MQVQVDAKEEELFFPDIESPWKACRQNKKLTLTTRQMRIGFFLWRVNVNVCTQKKYRVIKLLSFGVTHTGTQLVYHTGQGIIFLVWNELQIQPNTCCSKMGSYRRMCMLQKSTTYYFGRLKKKKKLGQWIFFFCLLVTLAGEKRKAILFLSPLITEVLEPIASSSHGQCRETNEKWKWQIIIQQLKNNAS